MKKNILFTTILLLSSSVIFDVTASAPMATSQAPVITVSGQASFNARWFHNKNQKVRNDSNLGQNFAANATTNQVINEQNFQVFTPLPLNLSTVEGYGRGYMFTMDDTSLKFALDGTTDYDMDYGAVIIVNGDTEQVSGELTTYDKTIKESYVWAGGTYGRIITGDTDGVESMMAFGGADPLGGTGGFDGTFDRALNPVTGTITTVDLVGSTGKATKITYQTPRFYGLQAGVTFTPQNNHLGEAKANTSRDYGSDVVLGPVDRRNIAGAINFQNEFENGLQLNASLTGIFAKTQPEFTGAQWFLTDVNGVIVSQGSGNQKNTASYAIGGGLSYKDFEFGIEFGDNGKSHEIKDLAAKTKGVHKNAGWFINTGVAYTYGPTKVSFGYMYAKRNGLGLNGTVQNNNVNYFKAKNRTNIFTFSVDQKLSAGAGIYFEYAHYDMKNEGFNVDAMLINSLNSVLSNGNLFTASGGGLAGPVGPKQKMDAFTLGTKVKF
ncbi:Porin [Candidatus Bealeia paramacronuclearis]|uniref:Porin n=1 Tax=Candidatus Bealeia paramacronuclearis TaxID=1921001 RepID=A0ABZ2C0K4_9PROT|nr:Porin [Candidatus Bealeia paramacronuclearis]